MYVKDTDCDSPLTVGSTRTIIFPGLRSTPSRKMVKRAVCPVPVETMFMLINSKMESDADVVATEREKTVLGALVKELAPSKVTAVDESVAVPDQI